MKKILLTGGTGFIGSNILKHLNDAGFQDVVIFDDIDAEKLKNIAPLKFKDFILFDPKNLKQYNCEYFSNLFSYYDFDTIIHMGANSSTTEKNPEKTIIQNFEFTKNIIISSKLKTRIIYASSASVYGNCTDGTTTNPLCLYALSKLMIDRWVNLLDRYPSQNILGLRFFNVFGPNEGHKKSQASVIYNWYQTILRIMNSSNEQLTIFDGKNLRDFIHVDDVCKIILHLLFEQPMRFGVLDVGTGVAVNFTDMINLTINSCNLPSEIKKVIDNNINVVQIPSELRSQYQTYTRADMSWLDHDKVQTMKVEESVPKYIDYLKNKEPLYEQNKRRI